MLLQTKLLIPQVRPDLIARPQLFEKLNAGLAKKSILVAAPAGYGKTTLIASWARSVNNAGHPTAIVKPFICWLTLDELDNDRHRFLAYLVAALQGAQAGIGQEFRSELAAAPQSPPAALLTSLLNELAAAGQDLLLVLDDFHHIEVPAVHEALIFFLEHLPPNVQVLVATRVDPPWPLARLRARDQLVEIRGPDLRFTTTETAAFLDSMGLALRPADIAALENRTEGWIAGLQMAALSMRDRDDLSAFIDAFAGSHRYILDYLIEEVVQRQPLEVRDFLLRTAVLDRLTAPLCASLLAAGDGGELAAGAGQRRAQAILEGLDEANLFIIRLDEERRWYRYHQLFADTLRNQLRLELPGEVPVLHRQAANWHAAHGYAREAVDHALAAEDFRLAGLIIQDNWRRLFHQGRVNTTLRWLESLPADLLNELPPLSVAYCWSLAIRGDIRQVPLYLDQAEAARERLAAAGALPADHPEYLYLSQQFRLLRSLLARFAGDSATAVGEASRSLAVLAQMEERLSPGQVALGRGAIYIQLGYGQLFAGDLAAAAVSFERSYQDSQIAGNFLAMGTALFELARLWQREGRLAAAANLCRETLTLAEQPEYAGWPAFFIVHIALADVLGAMGQYATASDHLQQGLALGRQSGQIYYLAHGYLVAEKLQQALNDTEAAGVARQTAEQLLAGIGLEVADLLGLSGEGPSRPQRFSETSEVSAGVGVEPLTGREEDVLRLLAAGLSNREIADALFLSMNTVKTHAKSLYGKLGVHNRTQAVVRARELGLLS